MSTLLPPTPETLQHVLTQGGLPTWLAAAHDPKFDAFLSETRTHVASGSFERVLEVCLDRTTEVLFNGVKRDIFSTHLQDDDASLEPAEHRERLAAMLPTLARWCHLALEGLPNELVDVRTAFLRALRDALTRCAAGAESGGHTRSYCTFGYYLYQLRRAFSLMHTSMSHRSCMDRIQSRVSITPSRTADVSRLSLCRYL